MFQLLKLRVIYFPEFPRRVASFFNTTIKRFFEVQDGFVYVADLEILIDQSCHLPSGEKESVFLFVQLLLE